MSIFTPSSSLAPLLSSTISTISLLLAASSGFGFLFPSMSLLETKVILSSTGKVIRQGVGIWGSCVYGESCTFQSPFSSSSLSSAQPQAVSTSTLPFAGTLFILLLLALLASSIQNFINLFVFLSQPPSTPSAAKKLSRDVGLMGGSILGLFISLLAYPSISLHWSSPVGGSIEEDEGWRVVGPGSGASLVVLAGLLLVWGGRERGTSSSTPSSPNDLESSDPIEKKDRSLFVEVEEDRSS